MQHIANHIEVFSFDLWGTLFDDSDYIRELDERRINACIEISNKYNTMQLCNWRKIFLNERRNFQKIERSGKCVDYKARIREILVNGDRNVNEKTVEELGLAFDKISRQYIPVVDQQLVAMIKKLRSRRKPCIILSNTGLISAEVTRWLLRKTNIYELFDKIYLSEEMGMCKPSIDFFLIPINEYAILPQQLLHIGDSDFFDLQPAKKVGCRSIRWKKKE